MNSTEQKNRGQDVKGWNAQWENLSPGKEIRKWDYFSLRPWIMKYAPRYGRVIEAGCGTGRYVFYLSALGIDIEGIDFSVPTIDYLNEWGKRHNFSAKFIAGDVTKLPYEDNSLSGYISLGVVEHFIEGPQKPLAEAYRVLRPGGTAIITTPSISWLVAARNLKVKAKNMIKRLIGRKIAVPEFFQYEYRPRKLKKLVSASGLEVTNFGGADLLYAFCQFGGHTGDNLKKGSFACRFSNTFENTFLRNIGAQSITIAIKFTDMMHCFLCGEKQAGKDSLRNYDVPVCPSCMKIGQSSYYVKGKKPKYNLPYRMNPEVLKPKDEVCEFCQKEYKTDGIFEYYGFSKKACPDCLTKPAVNIELSNDHVPAIWRDRK